MARNFISGVAVTIVAGLVLLKVEYNIFQTEEQLTPERESVEETRPKDKSSQAILPKKNALSVESLQRYDSVRIKEFLPLALQISNTLQRDTHLEDFIGAALEVADLSLAVEIANSISNIYTRNTIYSHIVDKAILSSDFKIAASAAKKISNPLERNAQIQKILRAGLSRGEN